MSEKLPGVTLCFFYCVQSCRAEPCTSAKSPPTQQNKQRTASSNSWHVLSADWHEGSGSQPFMVCDPLPKTLNTCGLPCSSIGFCNITAEMFSKGLCSWPPENRSVGPRRAEGPGWGTRPWGQALAGPSELCGDVGKHQSFCGGATASPSDRAFLINWTASDCCRWLRFKRHTARLGGQPTDTGSRPANEIAVCFSLGLRPRTNASLTSAHKHFACARSQTLRFISKRATANHGRRKGGGSGPPTGFWNLIFCY